jgi:ABC-type multidrug transport system fused ATPase/permease subunit
MSENDSRTVAARAGSVAAGRDWCFRDTDTGGEEERAPAYRGALRRLWREYLRVHWLRFAVVAACLVVMSGATFGVAYLGVLMVDRVLLIKAGGPAAGAAAAEAAAAGLETRTRWLLGLFVAYLAVRLVIALSYLGHYQVSFSIGQKVVLELRRRLQQKLLELHLGYFEERLPGKIYARVLDDAGVVQQGIASTYGRLVQNVFLLLFGLGTMCVLSWRLVPVLLAALPLYTVCYVAFRGKLRYLFRRSRVRNAELYGTMTDQIKGIRATRIYCQQERELGRFESQARRVLRLLVGYSIVNGAYSSLATVISGLGIAGLVALGGTLVRQGRLTTGELLFFYGTSAWLFTPVMTLAHIKVELDNLNIVLARIFEVLDTESLIQDGPGAVAIEAIRGEIRFEGVRLRYPGVNTDALRDINLSVSAGQAVALVGPSGAGKSSLVRLLLRLHDPTEGRILVDGRDIREIRLSDLRRLVSIVAQEPKLFSDTIAANIRYGMVEASASRVMEAARIADLHEFIMSLPEKYETMIGEEGVMLSGGQRQRLALAQAIITDPAVLILDDSLSALDALTEARITQALKDILSTRTCFVITHRLITAMNADLIVVLKDGRIVESGTHAELTERRGLYCDLFASR